ncbi:MAG: hypothetical protein PSX81_14055, partial [bacterium]|nr:hypothetical protein [bacterium]
MKYFGILIAVYLLSTLNSCIMRAPKYALSENVMTLKLGQSKEQVSKILGIEPYFVVSADDTQTVFLYKYRVADRATLPFLMKATNGKKVRGKFINLYDCYEGCTYGWYHGLLA